MSLRNSSERWGRVSQSLHWLIAALIVVMATLGLTMTGLPPTPQKVTLYMLHKSVGISILVLVALRLGWRLYAGSPATPAGVPAWQSRVASLTHAALYALLVAVPLSGWVLNSSTGFPLRWFNRLNLPAIANKSDALRAVAGPLHQWLFWALILLALAHAAAAIHHHLFRHDATLARMLPRGWLRTPATDEERGRD